MLYLATFYINVNILDDCGRAVDIVLQIWVFGSSKSFKHGYMVKFSNKKQ
jgi:hypothetical protein